MVAAGWLAAASGSSADSSMVAMPAAASCCAEGVLLILHLHRSRMSEHAAPLPSFISPVPCTSNPVGPWVTVLTPCCAQLRLFLCPMLSSRPLCLVVLAPLLQFSVQPGQAHSAAATRPLLGAVSALLGCGCLPTHCSAEAACLLLCLAAAACLLLCCLVLCPLCYHCWHSSLS